jgi:hypothetical protein
MAKPRITIEGGILEVSARVDLTGLKRLIKILQAQEVLIAEDEDQ